jgi:SH3-like domain-containing protein
MVAGVLAAALAIAAAASGSAETGEVAVAVASRGAVTNLPLPRYVTLKTDEGHARRGPGLSHRIDWVFTRAGMPLKVTAEFEHWRRIEDSEGAGGWIHYTLLSGSRAVLVTGDMTELRAAPDPAADPVAMAEYGVVARLLECTPGWCRIAVDGTRAWAPRQALWGVDDGETLD